MKKTLLYFLFFCISLHTNAQGFSKTYTLGYRYLEFYKNILEHDTLTMYGYIVTKDSISRVGVCLTKFDTLGNLISINTYFQPNNEEIYYSPRPSFIKTSANGYIGFLSLGDNTEGIIKFKHDGSVDFTKVITDNQPNIDYLRFEEIIEVEDGFVIVGFNDQPGLPSATVVYKLNKNLDKTLWHRTFYDPKWCLRAYISALKIKNKNINFIVEKSDWCMSPDVAKWTDIEYTLDSLGNKINETIIPSFNKLELHGAISIDSTSRLFYGEKLLGVIGSNYYFKTNIIKVDNKNNAIWNKIISDTSWRTGIKMGFKAKNNDIILVGNTTLPTPMGTKYVVKEGKSGVIYRYDLDGNLKWKKRDTVFSTLYSYKFYPQYPKFYSDRSFYSAVELPSGSIIACGFTDRYDYDVKKDSIREFHTEAWLYKVDKNGCINSKDCTTVSTKEEPKIEAEEIKIFPNPTNDIVNIEIAENQLIDNIEIYNISGKRLKYFPYQNQETKVAIALPENEGNLFLVKVKTKNGTVVIKKVVKN